MVAGERYIPRMHFVRLLIQMGRILEVWDDDDDGDDGFVRCWLLV